MLWGSLARSGTVLQPRRYSCCALSLGWDRDTGPEVGSCGRGQRVAPTCGAAGCRPPLSRIPRAARFPRGWMGVPAGGGVPLAAAPGSGARTSALAAPGKGGGGGGGDAKSQHDGGSQNAPQRRGWLRIVPALLVIAAFGRKPTEKPLLNVVFRRCQKPEGKKNPSRRGASASPRERSHVRWAVARGSGLLSSKQPFFSKGKKKKVYRQHYSALNVATSQRCKCAAWGLSSQLLYRSCGREIFCKRNRDGPVGNPAPELCTPGASGSSSGADCPAPVPPGCSPRGRPEPSRPPGRPGPALLPGKRQRRLLGIIAIQHLAGTQRGCNDTSISTRGVGGQGWTASAV